MNAITGVQWPRVPLGELAEHRLGKMLDKAKNTGVPRRYLRNPNIRWFHVDLSDLQEILVEEDEVHRYQLKPGDVLICEGGEAGRAAIWQGEADDVIFQKACHRVRVGPKLDARYLVHRLMFDYFRGGLDDYYTGATIKHFTGQDLARYKIPLPPLDEQRRIAAILDKADALRQKRNRAIALLDSLTQSIFLEMFGDPVTNPKKWLTGTLADMVHQVSDGPHVSPTYSDDGVPFLSTRHIGKSGVTWADLKFISPEDAAIHWKKCKPERGDLLYTKGGTTGIACVVDFDTEVAVWVHVALLKTDAQKANPQWLAAMLNSEYCYRQSQDFTHGIANRDLGLKRMVKIRMFLPPLAAQQAFADRVARLAEVGRGMSRQSETFDLAFASLQHRAFSGQL